MESITLEQIIRNHIQLPAYPSGKGWYHVLCKVCNDHGRKGERGAFKFEDDVVGYNCFNCKHGATYDPNKDEHMSKDMKTVLRDFGIPDEEWQQVLFSSLAYRSANGSAKQLEELKVKSIEPTELPIPESFYFLKEAKPDDSWAIIAKDYLSERGIDPDSHPFMLSHKPKEKYMEKWQGRVIIPLYKNKKLIFYQGRDLVGNKVKKYESPPVEKDKVLGGFDRIFEYTDAPLYVVEGWFDCEVIEGVAIVGNKITEAQLAWLNKSRREKVYIPDKFGDGAFAGNQAIDSGWSISTPDIGNCKDMSEAVNKYGKMYVLKTLADNTAKGFAARTKLGIYCK